MKAIRDLLAEIVDANHMAGKETAAVLGKKKAAGRFHSFSWQTDSHQQIDQKQGLTIMGFEAGATAGPALVFITLPAYFDDSRPGHFPVGIMNCGPQGFQKIGDLSVSEKPIF
jgi:hypothetical protein